MKHGEKNTSAFENSGIIVTEEGKYIIPGMRDGRFVMVKCLTAAGKTLANQTELLHHPRR